MSIVNVHDAKTHLSKYLDQVVQGHEVVISKHGKPVAKLVPMPTVPSKRIPGSLKGKLWIADDFDETPAEWLESMEEDTDAGTS